MASRSCGCASVEEGQRWVSLFFSHGDGCAVEIRLGVAFETQNGEKPGRMPEKKFLNKELQQFLTSKNVRHFVTYNETKAQIVERFDRTPKNRMWRYFTYQNRRRYLKALPALVDSYNEAKQCQHLRVPQQRSQWLQSNFTQGLRITRRRVAGGFGQFYLSAHVGEYTWPHR